MRVIVVHKYGDTRKLNLVSHFDGIITLQWSVAGQVQFSETHGWGLDKDVVDWRISPVMVETLGLKPFVERPRAKDPKPRKPRVPKLSSAAKRTIDMFGDESK